jgi:hypothetical protein
VPIYEDWIAFNVPSTALEPFYLGRFDPLLRKEERLLRLFKDERAPFYVIGVVDSTDLKHELAHALFFTQPACRNGVRAAMREYDTTTIEERLVTRGYHRRVLTDEVHAYLVAPGEVPGASPRTLAPLRKALRAIFREHAAGLSLP